MQDRVKFIQNSLLCAGIILGGGPLETDTKQFKRTLLRLWKRKTEVIGMASTQSDTEGCRTTC